jgi:hypothetical protein
MMTEETGSTGAADDLMEFEAEATGQPVTMKSAAIPAKYAGKSVEDMIQMHQNLEKLNGRQGQELGQMRRMADEILQLKKATTQAREEVRQPVTVETLLNDPEKILNSSIDSSDLARRTQAAEDRVARLESKITQESFVSKFPTFADDMQDPEFTAFVQSNPARQVLGTAASKDDYNAAAALWAMWEERKDLIGSKDESKAKPKVKVQSTVRPSAKTVDVAPRNWSRAKLMELRFKVADGDPAAVARWSDKTFQENMHKAYAEDRVK